MIDDTKIQKAKDGNIKAMEDIFSDTWKDLYRFIYYKVQNREEAEDITQDTYVKTMQYLKKNRISADKYAGFLKTVALNLLRDKWRKKKHQGIKVNFDGINPMEAAIEDPTERSIQRTLIENALSRLNKEQRTVIELRIIKGYSVAETAKIMDKNEGAVRSMQYRALQSLQGILHPNIHL